MISKKTNVLVCGTRFGEYYIKALRRDYERFNIVGILSRGSEYSEHIAEKYGLKNIKYCNSDNNFLLINHTNKVDIDLKNIFINIEKEVSLWD